MQAALSGEWKEAYAKQVSPPKAKPSEYELYLKWVYTNQIDVLDKSSDRGMTLVRLFLLGDYLGDDHFTNAVIDTLVQEIDYSNPAISFSKLIWTPSGPRQRPILRCEKSSPISSFTKSGVRREIASSRTKAAGPQKFPLRY